MNPRILKLHNQVMMMTLVIFLSTLRISFADGGKESAPAQFSPVVSKLMKPDAPFLTTANGPHQIQLLIDGQADLERRLQMIEHADSVDFETFEFQTDTTGKSLLQAMVRRSDQLERQSKPFHARILLDYGPDDGDVHIDRFLADLLKSHGIEVRYYNAAPKTLLQRDYRNHRKTFTVNENETVVGGRNLSDAYMGLYSKVNFVDRDLWARGPIAKQVDDTFNSFWCSTFASDIPPAKPAIPADLSYELSGPNAEILDKGRADLIQLTAKFNAIEVPKRKADAAAILAPDPKFDAELSAIRKTGNTKLFETPVVNSDSITLIADRPGRFGNSHIIGDYLVSRSHSFIPPLFKRSISQTALSEPDL